ncbi:MAG: hypothetical protein JXM73_13070 [Anaerolineae bacterium]|nr:hypothetical protein [Anaerolineae bacterium]
MSRSAYNLRRAAERVVGICEWVVFTVEGSMEVEGLPPDGQSLAAEETLLTY